MGRVNCKIHLFSVLGWSVFGVFLPHQGTRFIVILFLSETGVHISRLVWRVHTGAEKESPHCWRLQ